MPIQREIQTTANLQQTIRIAQTEGLIMRNQLAIFTGQIEFMAHHAILDLQMIGIGRDLRLRRMQILEYNALRRNNSSMDIPCLSTISSMQFHLQWGCAIHILNHLAGKNMVRRTSKARSCIDIICLQPAISTRNSQAYLPLGAGSLCNPQIVLRGCLDILSGLQIGLTRNMDTIQLDSATSGLYLQISLCNLDIFYVNITSMTGIRTACLRDKLYAILCLDTAGFDAASLPLGSPQSRWWHQP